MGKFSDMVKNKPTASMNNATAVGSAIQNKIKIGDQYYTPEEAAKTGQSFFRMGLIGDAFPYLEFAAKAGDRASIFGLASIYLMGVKGPVVTINKDRRKAIGLLQRAAILGLGQAARMIVDQTIGEIKDGNDISRVVWWCMRAEELGVSCKDHLSRFHPSILKDFESVYPEYMAGGRERMDSFMRNGDLYSHLDLMEGEVQVISEEPTENNSRNVSSAVHKETPSDWYKNANACLNQKDYDGAVKWFQKMAADGHGAGMMALAGIYDDIYKDDDKAGYWAKQALVHLEELPVDGQIRTMKVLAHVCGRVGGKYYDAEREKIWQDSIGALAFSKNGGSTLPGEKLVQAAAAGDEQAAGELAMWYSDRNENIKAAYWSERMLNGKQDSEVYLLIAGFYYSSGDNVYVDKAAEYAKKVISCNDLPAEKQMACWQMLVNACYDVYNKRNDLQSLDEAILWIEKYIKVEKNSNALARWERTLPILKGERQLLGLLGGVSGSDSQDDTSEKERGSNEEVDKYVEQLLQGSKEETIEEKAAKGDAEAQYDLGIQIWADEHDLKRAQGWLEKSAQQGYVDAMASLALICTDVSIADNDKAYEWSQKVVNSNDATEEDKAMCMDILGDIYSDDSNSKYLDLDKAVEWYKKSLSICEDDRIKDKLKKLKVKKRREESKARRSAEGKKKSNAKEVSADRKELEETKQQMNAMAAMNLQLMEQMQEMQKMMMAMQKKMNNKE